MTMGKGIKLLAAAIGQTKVVSGRTVATRRQVMVKWSCCNSANWEPVAMAGVLVGYVSVSVSVGATRS